MAGEIQLNSTTFATESGGTITVSNVDSATNRQNLGLEIGVDVQSYDADTTKNDVANTFTANQIISVTDNTNAALRVTQLGSGNALVVEDSTNPDSTPFVVDASGNVGIGTSSPSSNLEISASTNTGVQLTTTADSTPVLDFRTNGTDRLRISSSSATGATFNVRSNQDMQFYTNNTDRMRIDSSGNLLIRTDSASASAGVGIKLLYSSPQISITTDNPSNGVTAYTLYNMNATNNGYRFYVTTQGIIHAITTTISGISDQRLKENIRDLDVGLTEILQLQPRVFDWKVGKGKDVRNDRGFIAQEFELVFPDLIDEWKDPAPEGEEPYKSVRQDLIPVLVKAIQEQQTLIESQQSQIDALTARIEALETT
jgi:hypothetical protein